MPARWPLLQISALVCACTGGSASQRQQQQSAPPSQCIERCSAWFHNNSFVFVLVVCTDAGTRLTPHLGRSHQNEAGTHLMRPGAAGPCTARLPAARLQRSRTRFAHQSTSGGVQVQSAAAEGAPCGMAHAAARQRTSRSSPKAAGGSLMCQKHQSPSAHQEAALVEAQQHGARIAPCNVEALDIMFNHLKAS